MRNFKISKSYTPRTEDENLGRYLSTIYKIELIPPEEEVKLAQKIKKGDEDALEELVKANLRFVVSVAKQYQNQGVSLPDLINEGNIGLTIAAKKFDETLGFKFISYAVWWIRQSILKAIAEENIYKKVKYPLEFVNKTNQIRNYAQDFEKENRRSPNVIEMVEILQEKGKYPDMEKIMYALNSKQDINIVENPEDDGDFYGGEDYLDSIISSNPSVLNYLYGEDRESFINNILKDFSPKEREYINLVFYENYQVKNLIGNELGLTVGRVNVLRAKIDRKFEKIKEKIKKNQF